MSSLSEIRKRTSEAVGTPQLLQCMVCKAPTPGTVLSMLGAKCQRCFDAYCREPMPERCTPTAAALKRGELAQVKPPLEADDPLDLRPLAVRLAERMRQP